MKFDLKRIEFILIECDPEGLIKMGAPDDEYSSEAFMIYNRIQNENVRDLTSITVKVIGVLMEQFGIGHSPDRTFMSFRKDYFDNRIRECETIAKLIYDSAEKE